jgi:hypothetical protein
VPTQTDTSFDEINFRDNSNGSLPSSDRDGCPITKRKDAQLARNHKLIVKLTLTGPEIKISIVQKAEIFDSIFYPKN